MILSAIAAAVALVIVAGQPATAAPTTVVAWGTTTSAPSGFRATLAGVATAGPTDVWAVGADNPDNPNSQVLDQPYAEHWNGTAWAATPVSAPSLYGTHQAAQLNGTAAVGTGQAWAVGDVSDLWSVASQTLAFHWTGQAWTPTPTPNPGGTSTSNQLQAVAVRTATDVWAVGDTGYPETSLVARWNGSVWATVATPNIGGLQAVALDSASVWVGSGGTVERFDGTRWTTLPPLPVSAGSGLFLHGLVATATGLWAVGALSVPAGEGGVVTRSFAAVFNGTTWTSVGVAGSGLGGAAASGNTILAAAPNDGIIRISTGGVSKEVTPTPGTVYPDSVATDANGNAWAVGFSPASGGQAPGITNSPGINQGGILVNAGASTATVTWTGPVNHSGTADVTGHLSVGGLPDGIYTVISSFAGCSPGVATATITAGVATPVDAHVTC